MKKIHIKPKAIAGKKVNITKDMVAVAKKQDLTNFVENNKIKDIKDVEDTGDNGEGTDCDNRESGK